MVKFVTIAKLSKDNNFSLTGYSPWWIGSGFSSF